MRVEKIIDGNKLLNITCVVALLLAILLDKSVTTFAADYSMPALTKVTSVETPINVTSEKIHYTKYLNNSFKEEDGRQNYELFRLTEYGALGVQRYTSPNSSYSPIKTFGPSPDHTSTDWKASMYMDLDGMRDQIDKGDLKYYVDFSALNKKKSSGDNDYLVFAAIALVGDTERMMSRIHGQVSPEMMQNGWKDHVNTGWLDIAKGSSYLTLDFLSYCGDADNNDTGASNVRVYFYDGKGPGAKAIEATKGSYSVGDPVDFSVVFDEAVKINGDMSNSKLTITDSNGQPISLDGSDTNILKAACTGIDPNDSKKVNYEFTVPAGIDAKGLNVKLPYSGMDNQEATELFGNLTDIAGNAYVGATVGSESSSTASRNDLASINIDGNGPKIKAINIDNSLEALKIGSKINVDIKFDEKVKWSAAAPTITMNNGAVAGAAGDATGNGQDTIHIPYIVGASDNEINQLDIKTLLSDEKWRAELTGDITDLSGNPLTDFSVQVLDASSGKVTSCIAPVDKTSPNAIVTIDNSDWAKNHSVTIETNEVKASDEIPGSGISDTFKYTLNGSNYKTDPSLSTYQNGFSEGLSGAKYITPAIEAAEDGEYTVKVLATDIAGNQTTVSSDTMKFDRHAPDVGFTVTDTDGSIKGNLYVSITDTKSGFKTNKCLYQWVKENETLNDSLWNYLNAASDLKTTYSTDSNALNVPNNLGEVNRYKLILKVLDEAGNEEIYTSPVIQKDLTYAEITLKLPSDTQPAPYFFIRRTDNTVSADVYYQWVKSPVSGPISDAWIKDGDTAYVDTSNKSIGYSNFVVQKHFNNGQLFNGAWTLYIQATNKTNNVTSMLGPYEYIFDNTIPMVTLTGATYRPVRKADIHITVSDSAYGCDFPINGSYIWDGIPISTDFTSKDVLLKDYSLESGGVNGGSGTKRYNFGVWVEGADKIAPDFGQSNYVKQFFYFDYDAPTCTLELDKDVVNSTEFKTILKFQDKTCGDWEEYYSYSIDGSEWSNWNMLLQGSNRDGDYYYASTAEIYTLSLPNTNEGTHTVRFKFKDAAGNESEIYSKDIIYDRTPPKGELYYGTTSATNKPVEIKIGSVSDNLSSSDDIKFYYSKPSSNSGEAGQKWSDFIVNFQYNGLQSIWITDVAGNETELQMNVTWIDTQAPQIDGQYVASDWAKYKELIVKAAAIDNGKDAKLLYCFAPDNADVATLEWKETICGETVDDKITSEKVGAYTYYTYHMYTGGKSDVSYYKYNLYLKAIDDAGNATISSGWYTEIILAEPYMVDIKYTPDATMPTGGPVKAVVTFDEPVFLVPVTGSYVMPTDFGLMSKIQTVVINENGPDSMKVVNRFGNENLVEYLSVDWIDYSLKPKITYSYDGWTKEDVTATVDASENDLLIYDITLPAGATLEGTEGAVAINIGGSSVTAYKKFSCLFTDNGIVDYKVYNTQTQLSGQSMVVEDKIDRTAPTSLLSYSASKAVGDDGITDGYVTASLYNVMDNETDADSVSVISEGGAVWIFQENGSHDFVLSDKAGNTTTITATVNNIKRTTPTADTAAPTVTLNYTIEYPGGADSYDPDKWTNKCVHVMVIPQDDSPVTITDANGNTISNVHDFYENGDFIFYLTDSFNNKSSVTATVSKIDVTPPTGSVEYSNNNSNGSTMVTATLNASDTQSAVVVTNIPSLLTDTAGRSYYRFTQNGSFTFYITDEAGNTSNITATVDNIDNTAPAYTISAVANKLTNKDIVVNIIASEPLKAVDFLPTTTHEGVFASKNVNTVQVTFSNNADIILLITDMSGNITGIPITVDCIDKTPPTATYTIDESIKATEGKVTVTLNDIKDDVSSTDSIRIINNNGSTKRVFNDNGTFTFVLIDEAGNELDIPVTITGIDHTVPTLSLSYSNKSITKDAVTVTLTANEPITVINNNGSTTAEFTENGQFTFIAKDTAGNESKITAVVNNIDKTSPEITFDGDERLLYIQGAEYNLENYHAKDNVDGDLTAEVVKELNGFDINTPGDYSVTYSVSDKAGNTTTVTRLVSVIGEDSVKVFVNGSDPLQGTIVTEKAELKIDIFNAKGDMTVCWKEGKLKIGEMKTGTQQVTGNSFTISKTGWYTIVVRGQEKDYWLINVYVKALK